MAQERVVRREVTEQAAPKQVVEETVTEAAPRRVVEETVTEAAPRQVVEETVTETTQTRTAAPATGVTNVNVAADDTPSGNVSINTPGGTQVNIS